MQPTSKTEEHMMFKPREFRGSRFRCLLSTSLSKPEYLKWINSLVQPFAEVDDKDRFMPEGFSQPDEARLSEASKFLDDEKRKALTAWWLAVPDKANTPNWDFVSTCAIGERRGLILVEAKAHAAELKSNDCCSATNENNRKQIRQAIQEATAALGAGWSLKDDQHYQLSNRFAWSWKIASLGVPVVLVYLGFLNASEMPEPFSSHPAWEDCLLEYAKDRVPENTWGSKVSVNGAGFIPLIRSADVNIVAL
jgi:hypothetical protein